MQNGARGNHFASPLGDHRGVMTGMFLAALEATIIGTAMPTVVAALGGLAHFSWVFSAYLLTSTVFHSDLGKTL